MKKKFIFLSLTIVLLFSLVLSGCAQTAPVPASAPSSVGTPKSVNWPKVMAIGCAKEGTDYYSLGVAMGRVFGKYLPVTFTAQVSGGSFENVQRMKDGTREMAFVSGFDLFNATRGLRDYKEIGKVPVRVICMGGPSAFRIVTRNDFNIKTIPDLKGKLIEVASPGSIIGWDAMELIFKAYGMDLYKDSKPVDRSSPQSSIEHLKAGKADAYCTQGSVGNTPFAQSLEASTIFDLYYVPLEKNKIDTINKAAPYWGYGEILVGVDGQKNTNPVPCLLYRKALVCLPTLDQEIVYAITKAQMEHAKETGELYAPAAEFNLNDFSTGLAAPFHPGAIKYYKEKGMLTPEIESLSNRLLKETE